MGYKTAEQLEKKQCSFSVLVALSLWVYVIQKDIFFPQQIDWGEQYEKDTALDEKK